MKRWYNYTGQSQMHSNLYLKKISYLQTTNTFIHRHATLLCKVKIHMLDWVQIVCKIPPKNSLFGLFGLCIYFYFSLLLLPFQLLWWLPRLIPFNPAESNIRQQKKSCMSNTRMSIPCGIGENKRSRMENRHQTFVLCRRSSGRLGSFHTCTGEWDPWALWVVYHLNSLVNTILC